MSGGADKPGYVTPGMAVGPYTVDGQIGSGGFGFVYRVKRDGRAYALKIAHTRLGDLRDEDRESTIERLDREIAALKSLRHPNIVRVHSFDRWPEMESGYPYLVMDLVDGTPLQEWIAVAAPSVARIVAAFEKVADALAHMHELGIIHRDLKSQNILVTAGGEPFIVDFGIARPRVAYDVTRAAGVGTLSHLTPEYVAYLDSAGAHATSCRQSPRSQPRPAARSSASRTAPRPPRARRPDAHAHVECFGLALGLEVPAVVNVAAHAVGQPADLEFACESSHAANLFDRQQRRDVQGLLRGDDGTLLRLCHVRGGQAIVLETRGLSLPASRLGDGRSPAQEGEMPPMLHGGLPLFQPNLVRVLTEVVANLVAAELEIAAIGDIAAPVNDEREATQTHRATGRKSSGRGIW